MQLNRNVHRHGFKQGHLANVKPFFFFNRKYIKFAFENRGVHFYILSSSLNRGGESHVTHIKGRHFFF